MSQKFQKILSAIAFVTGLLLAVAFVLTILGVYNFVNMVDYFAAGDIIVLVVSGIFFLSAFLALVIPWKKCKPTCTPAAGEEQADAPAEVAPVPENEPEAVAEIPAPAVMEEVAATVPVVDPDLTAVEFTGIAPDDELDLDNEFVVVSNDEAVTNSAKNVKSTPSATAFSEQENDDDFAKILSKINAIIDMVKDGER